VVTREDILARVSSAREALARDIGTVDRLRRAAGHPDAPPALRTVADLVDAGDISWDDALNPRSEVREIARLYAGSSQRALRPILVQLDAEEHQEKLDRENVANRSAEIVEQFEEDYSEVDTVFETREEAELRVERRRAVEDHG
jgi:hypothetical protein